MKSSTTRLNIFLLIFGFTSAVKVTVPGLGVIEGNTGITAWSKRTIYNFLTVKYAKSPVGERRFAPPIAATPWEGVYDATSNGISCPQSATLEKYKVEPQGVDLEDCLSLNIFTPMIPNEDAQERLLPVMVFIHGGAFNTGDKEHFPPGYLLEHDVLLVVLQYRLNVFGFMSLETEGMPGNVGLLDQLMALRWINKYIKYFGGDNTRVTLFGQSAGGCSVSLHMINPEVEKGLFQQAIIQSGASLAPWPYDHNVKNTTRYIYRYLTDDESENVSVTTMEDVFKNASVLSLLRAVNKATLIHPWIEDKIGRIIIQNVGSMKYLKEHPNKLIENGNFKSMPLMAGVTKNDGSYMVTGIYDKLEMTNSQNDDQALRDPSSFYLPIIDDTDTVKSLLNNVFFKKTFENKNLTFKDIAPGLVDLAGIFKIKGQILKMAKINSEHKSESYLYSFHYKGEHTRFGYGKDTEKYPFHGGVHHSDDLLYLFPFHYKMPLNEHDSRMAKIMSDLWATFAINGRPTSALLDRRWKPIEKGKNGPYMEINTTPQMHSDFVDIEFKITSEEAGLLI